MSIKYKKFQTKEFGRSMVEMLGVLAIIGILSITAIFGYKFAMNKYKANTLANEINLTRNLIEQQLIKGLNIISLESPYDNNEGNGTTPSGYAFDYGCTDGSSNLKENCMNQENFYVAVSGINQGVCEKLIDTIKFMPHLTEILVNNYKFENDVSVCKTENDLAEVVAVFSATDAKGLPPEDNSCTKTSDCAVDFYCINQECTPCPETTHRPEGKDMCFCEDGKKWNEEKQQCESLNCDSNSECDSGYYCRNGVSNATSGNLCVQVKGTCTLISRNTYKSYVKSSDAVNYRAAMNFCATQGKSIITLSKFLANSSVTESPDGYIPITPADLSEEGKGILKAFYGSETPATAIYIQDDMGLTDSTAASECIVFMFMSKYPYSPFNKSTYGIGAAPYNMQTSGVHHTAICQ